MTSDTEGLDLSGEILDDRLGGGHENPTVLLREAAVLTKAWT